MQSKHSDSTLRGAELQRLLNLVERLSNAPTEELPAWHQTSKAISDSIAKFAWPVAIIFIAWMLISNDILSDFLNNNSITYKNKDMALEINKNNNNEILDLSSLFNLLIEENNLIDNNLSKAIKKKIDSMSKNLTQGIGEIKDLTGYNYRKGAQRGYSTSQAVGSGSNLSDGFAALLERDIDSAISSFEAARKSDSNLRDITAILAMLTRERSSLKRQQSPDWERVFATILVEYSWNIPSEFRTEIRDIALDYYH